MEADIKDESKENKESSTNFKIFGIWSTDDVSVIDLGLKPYINLNARLLPKTYGRPKQRLSKAKISIVERLINLLQVPGHRGKKHKIITSHATGKYNAKAKILIQSFGFIQKALNKNPIQVLIKAIENSTPHDEVTAIEYGGARYPQAVDIAPQRRLDIALRNMVRGAYDKAFNKKKSMAKALAEEITAAYNNSNESFAITKRNETEKQADSAR